MGAKSEQKKAYILEVAKEVFIEKGFRTVTMKDIVEACEISRGGLYLYYNNSVIKSQVHWRVFLWKKS